MDKKGSWERGEEGGECLSCLEGVPSGLRSAIGAGRGRPVARSERHDSLMFGREKLRLWAVIAPRRVLLFMLPFSYRYGRYLLDEKLYQEECS
ncbi:unnamed protein product [Chondrus crispus]|uniref:Uncharacterized protein n=1 Tax=Chondrus crispus TaxID=2769 RepID=R7Q9M5_CHOCR|nr:unnamed protein product [Chondrus crispus]CDF34764.1 unnamed protein product [Chondrus crispus]|eukprot:XP_005714583.1 unnamed protein product [Chondrus crispus]